MVITGTNVTFDDLLKMEVDKNDLLNDELLKEMKSYGSLTLPMEDINNIDITINLADCNNWNLANMTTSLKDSWQATKDAYLVKYKEKITNQIKDLKNTNIKQLLLEQYNIFKNIILSLWEDIKTKYNNVIKFFESNYRKFIILFKKLKGEKLSKDDKSKIKIKIINELKRLGQDAIDMFGIYVIVDIIKCMWNISKNLFGCKKEKINETLKNNNEAKELLNNQELKKSERIGPIINTIVNLIEVFGLLLVISAAINDIIKAEREANEKYLNDSVNDIEKENKKIQNLKNNKQNLSDLSLLENLLNSDNDNKENNKNRNIISICPVYDDSTATSILNSNGYIIEFGKDIENFKISVKNNEKIELEKIIGYINEIPIKSKIQGTVKYLTDRHIVINKNMIFTDEFNNELNVLLNKISSSEKSDVENVMSEFAEKMTNMNNIEILVKDYLNLIYKPIIYGKVDDNTNEETSNYIKINESAEHNHIKLRDDFNNDIKNICGENNVKSYAEKNKLSELKDIILNRKYNFIDDIFNNINEHVNRYYYISKDKNDYIMSDYYLDFMLSEYLDNPYFDKLFNIIKNFYLIRFNIENKNKDELIKKFNNKLKEDNIKNKTYYNIKEDVESGKYENIKKYLETIYPIKYENRLIKINSLSNLYTIINEIKTTKNYNNEKSLKKITNEEHIILLNFINDLKKEYDSYKDIINNISNLYNIINWPNNNDIYINNVKYEHYLFTNDCLNSNTNLNNYEDAKEYYESPSSGLSEAGINSLAYWMKYCGQATLMNCGLPAYWSTGLIILGIPIPLPIILIPMTYINGPISTVIGLGICGIAIAPMMLIVNMSDNCGAALFAINMVIETMKQILTDLKHMQYQSIAIMCKSLIETVDKKIKSTEDEIRDIKKQISLYKNL